MPWLDARALVGACPGLRGDVVLPRADQDLTVIPARLESMFETAGAGGTVIVLALDGVSYEAAAGAWRPDELVALTSTFPSTSVPAWLSATSGRAVAEHGVPGVVIRTGKSDLFNTLADGPGDPGATFLGRHDTVFRRLTARGVDCVGLIGDLKAVPGRWSSAVVDGLRVLPDDADWTMLRHEPERVPDAIERGVDRALGAITGRPTLVWAYVHIDPYIHDHGFDAAVRACLAELGAAAERWAAAGHVVVAHSDHGMVETDSPEELMGAFDDATGSRWCRLPPGGAGRVRWAYPHAASEDAVLARLEQMLGDDALVCPIDALEGLGIAPLTPILRERMGEIVAIAGGRRFPLHEPKPFEHGALTPDEMLVPFAIWHGR